MKAVFLILFLPVLIIPVFALESDTEYFIESENIFLILSTDSANEIIFDGGGVTADGVLFEFDEKQIKVIRITENGDHGRIFGKTIQGNYYYVIYDITDDDVKLYAKVWHNNTTTRLVEVATIEKLF